MTEILSTNGSLKTACVPVYVYFLNILITLWTLQTLKVMNAIMFHKKILSLSLSLSLSVCLSWSGNSDEF